MTYEKSRIDFNNFNTFVNVSEKHLNVQRAIKRYGMTQKDVVDKMEEQAKARNEKAPMTLQSFKNTLCGGNPTTKVLLRIAEAIGCEVGELFDDFNEHKRSAPEFACPHCGKPITITLGKEEKEIL